MDGLATLDAHLLVALGSAAGEGLGPRPGNVHATSPDMVTMQA
jgi:hypothetical protein